MSNDSSFDQSIHISLERQRLTLVDGNGSILTEYPVSTALNGPGEQDGSGCTPQAVIMSVP